MAAEGSFISTDDLKDKGRQALEQADSAREKAEEARTQAELYSKAGKDLQRQVFKVQLLAGKLDTAGDVAGAKEQRKVCVHLKGLADKNFHSADKLGEEAAELERKAFKLRLIANKLADEILRAGG